MANNFTVEGRMATLSDIQRDFLFEVIIPNISLMTGGIISQEGLILRTKTAAIPDRGNDPIDSFFMGMKQLYPGRPVFANTLAINVDETEDQIVTKALYAWRQRIFDIDHDSPTGGYSQAPNKRSISTEVILRQYKYNGEKLENDIVFTNAWPSAVAEVGLSMEGNGRITYAVTFTYDIWRLRKS